LLLGYWAIMYAFGEPGNPYSLETNAAMYLDKFFMADSHLYHGEGIAFDPEGILSTLPAIVNVIAGYLTGLFIQEKGKTPAGVIRLISIGTLLLLVAWLWHPLFPVNKKLWTSSFVLNTVGLDLLIISVLIYIIDFKGWTGWTGFFTVFGKNPLFLYLLSEVGVILLNFFMIGAVTAFAWLNINIFQPAIPGKVGSLLFAVTYMLFCWCVGKILDNKRIYVRV